MIILEFKSCYKPFVGKKLEDIANEIEKQTPQGREFQEELLEQAIAYLIEINSEDE